MLDFKIVNVLKLFLLLMIKNLNIIYKYIKTFKL